MSGSWSRRLVYFDTDIRVEGLEQDDAGIALLNNEELQVVPMSEADNYMHDYVILGGVRPQPNMLLVLSPYDDKTYMDVSDARTMVAIEKASLTIRLCKLLGAKRVEIVNIKIVENEKTKEIDLTGSVPLADASGSIKVAGIENLRNQIKLQARFHGGEPSISKAEALITSSRLISDPLLKNLVEMVKDDIESTNKTKEISMNVSLTHSLQSTLDVAARLKFPSGSTVGANVHTMTKEKVEIYIEMKMEF